MALSKPPNGEQPDYFIRDKKLLIIEKYEVVSSLLFALSKFLFLLTERTRELGQLIDRQKIEK